MKPEYRVKAEVYPDGRPLSPRQKTIVTFLWILTGLFCIGLLSNCAGYQQKAFVNSHIHPPYKKDHLVVTVVNNTDRTMYHGTYWLNHDFKGYAMYPAPICGAELEPGEKQQWLRGNTRADYEQLWQTSWHLLGYIVDPDTREEIEAKYNSRIFPRIPVGTAEIRIFHRDYKAIPFPKNLDSEGGP